MDDKKERADLLYGVPAIAEYMRLTARQVYHLKDSGAIPTFTLDGISTVCARRSTINAWLADQEAKATA